VNGTLVVRCKRSCSNNGLSQPHSHLTARALFSTLLMFCSEPLGRSLRVNGTLVGLQAQLQNPGADKWGDFGWPWELWPWPPSAACSNTGQPAAMRLKGKAQHMPPAVSVILFLNPFLCIKCLFFEVGGFRDKWGDFGWPWELWPWPPSAACSNTGQPAAMRLEGGDGFNRLVSMVALRLKQSLFVGNFHLLSMTRECPYACGRRAGPGSCAACSNSGQPAAMRLEGRASNLTLAV
jgi:hypothetical protein